MLFIKCTRYQKAEEIVPNNFCNRIVYVTIVQWTHCAEWMKSITNWKLRTRFRFGWDGQMKSWNALREIEWKINSFYLKTTTFPSHAWNISSGRMEILYFEQILEELWLKKTDLYNKSDKHSFIKFKFCIENLHE